MVQPKLKEFLEICTILNISSSQRMELLESVMLSAVSKIIKADPELSVIVKKVDSKITQEELNSIVAKLNDSQKERYIVDVSKSFDEYIKQVSKTLNQAKKEEVFRTWNI